MLGLPPSTAISRPLYKNAVFEKFNLKAADRNRFDADISKMVLVNYVSPARVAAIGEGREVKEFYVLQVLLKRREYDDRNILLLQKLIPQHIVFALQYEDETQICVVHTRLLRSAWMPTASATIPLQGISLDDVWQGIVAAIGGLDAGTTESLEVQIIKREERERLLRQIETLERRCRSEKQTRKKYELHQQLLALKRRMEE